MLFSRHLCKYRWNKHAAQANIPGRYVVYNQPWCIGIFSFHIGMHQHIHKMTIIMKTHCDRSRNHIRDRIFIMIFRNYACLSLGCKRNAYSFAFNPVQYNIEYVQTELILFYAVYWMHPRKHRLFYFCKHLTLWRRSYLKPFQCIYFTLSILWLFGGWRRASVITSHGIDSHIPEYSDTINMTKYAFVLAHGILERTERFLESSKVCPATKRFIQPGSISRKCAFNKQYERICLCIFSAVYLQTIPLQDFRFPLYYF